MIFKLLPVILYVLQVGADEVCGCPLVKDVFEETGDFCHAAKRRCNKHYCWEKCRRAEIDMERVRMVSKLVWSALAGCLSERFEF